MVGELCVNLENSLVGVQILQPGVVVHAFKPSIREVRLAGPLRV